MLRAVGPQEENVEWFCDNEFWVAGSGATFSRSRGSTACSSTDISRSLISIRPSLSAAPVGSRQELRV